MNAGVSIDPLIFKSQEKGALTVLVRFVVPDFPDNELIIDQGILSRLPRSGDALIDSYSPEEESWTSDRLSK
ncbi:MAG: hypothetical protein ACREVL_01900, partial [Solimonas sp.]